MMLTNRSQTMRDEIQTAFLSIASALLLAAATLMLSPVHAQSTPPSPADAVLKSDAELQIQGSTTFQERILMPNLQRIETTSGVKLNVVGNKSIWGLIALLERRADMAMISADLSSEITAAQKTAPGLPFENLTSFEIARSRIAFAVHPSNPVRTVSLENIAQALTGDITNWKDLGGPNLPIRIIATQDGGGTVVAVRTKLLKGGPIAAPGAIRLESAKHVIMAVEQEPGALAIAQLGLVMKAGLPELETGPKIEQQLTLVTLGAPTTAMTAVIDAMRAATAANPL
jgi:phosphate transport system substrate-binding protein